MSPPHNARYEEVDKFVKGAWMVMMPIPLVPRDINPRSHP